MLLARFVRAVAVLAAATVAMATILVGVTPARAATPPRHVAVIRHWPATLGVWALLIANNKRGAPYRYGAAGPTSFDCSGLTMWTWAQLGRHLPRTAAQQRAATRWTSRPAQGDLVFFGGASPYHVGIYAGNGWMIDSPHTGARVTLRRIWTSAVSYGHVT